MEKIKVGEYIRDKEGHITKIINTLSLFKDVYLYLGEDGYQYNDNAILKHNPNIIELLEVKDIIKYQELRSVTNIYGTKFYENYICDIHSEEELEQIKKEIKEHKIRLISILTKELFKNSEYEV